ncbi:hypothetical protein [Ramlibacter sp. WS9]|uniref:hypothetical protein n=1 Tax=Ramlibacter sp. WS9 TaxID=1882741 RepID=UPI00114200DE|nr:hypothetical protein [Ramlibacter sp. WS9]ROZ72738.1 hypothetical protein EEB15_18665 [Ramlibacter sp. WS9]
MGYATLSAASPALASGCYRLTVQGRACVDLVETPEQTIGSLSRYLHDVLMLCGTGTWFEQLRQFMPPRSLEESLQSLLALGLIEQVSPQQSPRYVRPSDRSEYAPRPVTALARLSHT